MIQDFIAFAKARLLQDMEEKGFNLRASIESDATMETYYREVFQAYQDSGGLDSKLSAIDQELLRRTDSVWKNQVETVLQGLDDAIRKVAVESQFKFGPPFDSIKTSFNIDGEYRELIRKRAIEALERGELWTGSKENPSSLKLSAANYRNLILKFMEDVRDGKEFSEGLSRILSDFIDSEFKPAFDTVARRFWYEQAMNDIGWQQGHAVTLKDQVAEYLKTIPREEWLQFNWRSGIPIMTGEFLAPLINKILRCNDCFQPSRCPRDNADQRANSASS